MHPVYEDIERRHALLRDDIAVILCLSITSATTAQQIARYTGRPKNSISRSVNTLAERDLIDRRASADDGRAVVLSLSATGKGVFRDIGGDFAQRDRELLAELSPAERRQFIRLALKVSASSSQWAGEARRASP
jgi:DNA-binding MarR family transcriptional regulator